MAQAVGPLIDTVLQRVRDEQGAIHPRAVVLRLFDHAHRALNGRTEDVLTEVTLTTKARRTVYAVNADISGAVRVKAVRENGRELSETTLSRLAHSSRMWFRDIGDSFQLFAPIGRDVLALYPAKDADDSVTVVIVTQTASFSNENALTEIDDDNIPKLLDLVEMILLTRGRDFGPVGALTKRFLEDLQIGEVRRVAVSR